MVGGATTKLKEYQLSLPSNWQHKPHTYITTPAGKLMDCSSCNIMYPLWRNQCSASNTFVFFNGGVPKQTQCLDSVLNVNEPVKFEVDRCSAVATYIVSQTHIRRVSMYTHTHAHRNKNIYMYRSYYVHQNSTEQILYYVHVVIYFVFTSSSKSVNAMYCHCENLHFKLIGGRGVVCYFQLS